MTISRRLRYVGVVVVLALVGGVAYAESTGAGSSTVNACAKTLGGQLRLDNGDGCLSSEQSVVLGQGSPDSTTRNMTGFMFNNSTASTPVLSQRGQLGTLSLTCANITYATNPGDVDAFDDRVMFTSDQVAGSPLFDTIHDHFTVAWTSPGNRSFQILIEGLPGTTAPVTLTSITGFVKPFPEFSGCSYFAYVQTSEVRSPQTLTP